jgi:hypothetical protein
VTPLGHFDAIRERVPRGAFSVSFFTRRKFFKVPGGRCHPLTFPFFPKNLKISDPLCVSHATLRTARPQSGSKGL